MSAGRKLSGAPEPMHSWPGAGGVCIAADSWGAPTGPLVMLLHGGGQTRHAWRQTGERLGTAGYFAIALDARGHGDSSWAPDGRYGQDVMVDDLLCALQALGDRRPVLVGASMGGGTSLVAVGEDRVDATALIMVDIAPRIEPDGAAKIVAFMNQNPDGFESLQAVAAAIANYQPHRKRPRTLEGLAKNVRLSSDGRYRWHWDPQFRPGVHDTATRQRRLESCAANLKLPTLLVRGGLSDVLTEHGVQEFLTLCPHAEYVNVADAAHMVAGDRNDAFGDAAIDFLSRAVPVGRAPLQAPHALHPHRVSPVTGDLSDLP